ncbi:3'-phosphoesterase / DNA ligase D / DNA repair polymerase [Bosea sp. 62]|uniref:DNA ligase D n=1 Tax=unclassified Bosea (in: a-proteobacteria) TaxID=2653178 RepID=UPI0012514A3A|nr:MULTISPECIES: DNA ligase D [unclassified Bosea (in: a-proteobacteria)]CAD5283656.1 3'-phosphoesterase / DNA ligase D / DNA repair polymerase [Bosea sp. 21B]CAD5286427.1 3'-phosphoesterase / DNA ligase D / DNA repair polymerase [Bosea sp. 46]CAD5301797.1 3'-phosphoesterase / DNA ligase D / DNA repair polymerase [Bosea sp. 7B]VVT51653.1 3'-phosphoesterase / DNA ligase D / DNA repair polymerase [Bosea sp. EC-HK365B]VXB16427.1 3'-phosphoesterase / DNA ligase D / DNA repair polymerase [Bosea sp.
MANLDLYRSKRDFSRTREPKGAASRRKAAQRGAFVIHKHAARRLHYDLRLEHDGVLWSWAVTRGPSLDPGEKRLAVHVEDHPLEYGSFEGTIPEGEYGAGSVIVWDEGKWIPEGDPVRGMEKGHLAFALEGHKLGGHWHLVRLKPRRGEKRDNWLLIKVDDEFARDDEDILETAPDSVKSGRSVEEVGEDPGGDIWSTDEKPAKGRKLKVAKSKAAKAKPAKAKPAKTTLASHSAKAEGERLPRFIEPCLATLLDKPPGGDAWLHEVKFDGYRLQARISAGKVRLLTRTGLDWTERFGDRIADALAAMSCETALIDGEVVALGENGISSFSALQAALSDGETANLVFFAFDLLHLDGEDLRAEPLLARKERLEELLKAAGQDAPLRYSEHFVEPGQTMLRHACRMGLEGVISKRAEAPYRSGRGRDWIKSKCTQRQEFVIAGYVPSKASPNQLGSLVLGYYEDRELKPAGRVGTGFTRNLAAALKKKLDAIAAKASPFKGEAGRERGIVWVRPELVAEIAFGAWTASKTLRHSSFLGLREDKPAQEVIEEKPVKAGTKAPRAVKSAGKRAPVRGTTVTLRNPQKPLWPDIGFTKQGLLDYYASIWERMAPFVIERPLSLLRAPDGVGGQVFFQKHAGAGLHKSVSRMKDKDGEELLFIRDFDGLAALVQLGTVEVHVWGAKVDAVDMPDQVIFDLDPDMGVPMERVREAALAVRQRLDELGFESFLKTSGGKGFHVVLPLQPKADWNEVKGFARDFAKAMEQAEPKLYTATLSKKARKGRIFIDYLRNGRGSTAIAPFSTRVRPGAAVAMPVAWELLERDLAPDAFKAPEVTKKGPPDDAWAAFFKPKRPLKR